MGDILQSSNSEWLNEVMWQSYVSRMLGLQDIESIQNSIKGQEDGATIRVLMNVWRVFKPKCVSMT